MNTPERHIDPLTPVTRSELRAELGPIREALARLEERMDHLATKDEVARLEERMDYLATKDEVARLNARLTWRIVIAMGVLTVIFSAIVAMLTRSPGG